MGLLGAGKTTALRELEDRGWEAIDNLPVRLLEQLIEGPPRSADDPVPALAIGFDSRTRGFSPDDVIALLERLRDRAGLTASSLFLDCGERELERRYNETRRRHPLAIDQPVSSAIAAERALLAPLRAIADTVLDTSDLTSNGLREVIRGRFALDTGDGMTVTVSSFGFSRAVPPVADLVFDMRFLDNPHWDPGLRRLSGRDPEVGEHIRRDPSFADAFVRIRDLLLLLLPRYRAQGKPYVHIAFGCTGGRHRSVFAAEQIASALRGAGFSLTLLHRNLELRPFELDGAAR